MGYCPRSACLLARLGWVGLDGGLLSKLNIRWCRLVWLLGLDGLVWFSFFFLVCVCESGWSGEVWEEEQQRARWFMVALAFWTSCGVVVGDGIGHTLAPLSGVGRSLMGLYTYTLAWDRYLVLLAAGI